MSNLLDKASIILTPTAYDNGKVLCAKPSEPPYGDFDFSRNSAATRVNAQGLVENVQILSSNLVQNGDFSEEGAEEVSNGSFSQEGVEQVTNGDFATDSDWNKSASATISSGVATLTANASNVFIYQTLWAANAFTNKTVKVTYTIISNTLDAGKFKINGLGGADFSLEVVVPQTVGTHSVYIPVLDRAGSDNRFAFLLNSEATSGAISIDNVSVREVGQDWTLGTGWSIGEDKAVLTNVGYNINCTQANVTTIGQYYKVEFTILDYISGQIRISLGGSATSLVSANGTYVFYLQATINNVLVLQPLDGSGTNLSITNISVKEVGQNWDILNDVTSFSFNNGIANIQGTANSANNGIKQASISAVIGKTYKISATLRSNDGGLYRFRLLDGSYFDLGNGNSAEFETITSYHTATSTAFTIFATSWFTNGTSNFDITNISVIEITTDTSLPRINYEGFSYQDALGSELVLNGGFDSGSDWGLGTNWSISGGNLLSTNSAQYVSANQNISGITLGKTYEININVNSTSGGYIVKVGSSGSIYALSLGLNTITAVWNGINNGLAIYNNASSTGNISIDNVSVKEYLGQEVVPDSGCGSWLFEPQSTNLIPYSSDYSGWSKNGANVLSGFVSPDGTTNASKITAASADPNLYKIVDVGLGKVTFSFYAKADEPYVGRILFWQIGTAVVSGAISHNFTLSNDWQRYEATIEVTTAGTLAFRLDFPINDGGNVGEYGYLWGAQVEQQSYATSYIPTNGEANGVTRNQDVCTNGGSLASINSTEGTLYAEIAALAKINPSGNITLTDGTGNNRIYIYYLIDNSISVIYNVNSTGASINNFSLANITDQTKIAVRWGNSNVSVWINGASVLSNTTSNFLPNTLNVLSFAKPAGGVPFEGKTKALAVWKEALSDSELQSLTTI